MNERSTKRKFVLATQEDVADAQVVKKAKNTIANEKSCQQLFADFLIELGLKLETWKPTKEECNDIVGNFFLSIRNQIN